MYDATDIHYLPTKIGWILAVIDRGIWLHYTCAHNMHGDIKQCTWQEVTLNSARVTQTDK